MPDCHRPGQHPGPTRRRFVQTAAIGATAFALTPASLGRPGDDEAGFLAAAAAGDLETVKQLLAERPELVGARDAAGRTAFALAHLAGHRAVGDHLVTAGHRPDVHEAALALDWDRFGERAAEDPDAVHLDHPIGGNAMVCAAAGGAGSSIWRAYAVTASPNPVVRAGRLSPLQTALRFRDLGVAEMTAATLLANSADPNGAGDGDASPLHIAAERGSTELVELLVRTGADVDAKDGAGRTALDAAEAAGHPTAVELLRGHADIPRTCSTSRTAYDADGNPYDPPPIDEISIFDRERFVGASHFDLDYVRKAAGDDGRLVHSVATTGEICVEACAHTGRKEVVDFLLEQGAPCSLPTAVMRDDVERVRALLDEDPLRIHERGAHGFALLWYPVIGRCGIEMMELLLARGAEVEDQHFLGTTALHWACMRGPVEVAELLIERGADVERVGRKFDAAGQTPLQCAESRDRADVAKLLRGRGAKR